MNAVKLCMIFSRLAIVSGINYNEEMLKKIGTFNDIAAYDSILDSDSIDAGLGNQTIERMDSCEHK